MVVGRAIERGEVGEVVAQRSADHGSELGPLDHRFVTGEVTETHAVTASIGNDPVLI